MIIALCLFWGSICSAVFDVVSQSFAKSSNSKANSDSVAPMALAHADCANTPPQFSSSTLSMIFVSPCHPSFLHSSMFDSFDLIAAMAPPSSASSDWAPQPQEPHSS